MRFLLDASALYPLAFVEGGERVLVDSSILDLTVYEVGNIVWKRARRGFVDVEEVVASLEELLGLVEIIRVDPLDLGEIEAAAVERGLTFYDSAYLYYSEREDLTLVTEDRRLAEEAGERATNVRGVLEALNGPGGRS